MSFPTISGLFKKSMGIKKANDYPVLEEEKDIPATTNYICSMWKNEFTTPASAKMCPSWGSKSIEKNDVKKKPAEKPKENILGALSRFTKDAADQFGEIFESAGSTISGSAKAIKGFGKEIKPTFDRTISELASVKDIVLYRTRRNQDGEERKVEIKLEDTLRKFFIKFGLADKKNPQFPAEEKDLKSLEEMKITKDDYKLNDITNEYELPECSICICEIEDKGVKTVWKNYHPSFI